MILNVISSSPVSAAVPTTVRLITEIPKWQDLNSILEILGDHHEWDRSYCYNNLALLGNPTDFDPQETNQLVWGNHIARGNRTDDEISILLSRRVIEAGEPIKCGFSKDTQFTELPLIEADFDTLKKKEFILVNHNTGESTESKIFKEVKGIQDEKLGKAILKFDLRNDFTIPQTKARSEVTERLKSLHWLTTGYTLIVV